jgi:hypothetical protein
MRGRYDIVAGITRAIAHLLQEAVGEAGDGLGETLVTTRRPAATEPGAQPQINIFLFHVLPNPYLRNLTEPWRVEGWQVEEPTTALDLLYLISFTGSEDIDRLQPQQLLGITANALNVGASIRPDRLVGVKRPPPPLDNAVQLSPHSLTVEEMSRLWAMFPNVPYQLSICYRASAALIVADVPVKPNPKVTAIAPQVAPTSGSIG